MALFGGGAAVREVQPSVPFREARDRLLRAGFHEDDIEPDRVVFKRQGTQLTMKGERFPLQLELRAEAEDRVSFELSFDTFVAFGGGGDLEKLADRLVKQLRPDA